ncbi:hypothetical protein GTP91_23705 [Rugamonas sp. FT82W]|uniref:RHS repeat-associated core domain-containing protein n=1 Tax=Duganella vulcania TaxID=2692166 RepID=A0A845G9T7_9BURK|nr:RHS repeat-associated core domain-containing protein [Duganella vulcania]MYM90165.1 hypothetical protein [Duganella vulcania]
MKKHFREFYMPAAVTRKKNWAGTVAILLGFAGAATVEAGTVTSTTSYEYDPVTGFLVTQTREPDNAQIQLKTKYTYDKFGNRLTTEVSSPATGAAAIPTRVVSKVTYDEFGSPRTISNALGQTVNAAVDPANQPLFIDELNGLRTTWIYDDFGRKTLEVRPDGNRTKWDYFICPSSVANVSCPSAAKYAVRAQPLDVNSIVNGPVVVTYYDGLNRLVRTQSQGFDGATIYQFTEYDSLGRIYRTSRPWGNQTLQWTVFGYDALGRLVSTTYPDGSVALMAYNGLTTTVTNALNQTQTRVTNSQGQLLQVTDTQGNSLSYAYDARGNVTKTTDPRGNVTTMVYDDLGRKISMADPDLGTVSNVYNVLGELKQQTDAKGQVSTFSYDLLGRMTSRAEPDLVSNWTYDSCTMGKGRLCKVTADNGYVYILAYDRLGRSAGATTTVDTSYSTSNTYDVNGHLATQVYPTGLTIKYAYTTLGYLKEVRNSATDVLYWQANTLDAEGHLLQQTYGNNVVTQQVFDTATGRIRNIYAGVGNVVQNLSMTYDARGNMLSRNDANQNLAETFLYDTLNRLTSNTVNSSGAGLVTQSYGYDSIGNITSRSDMGAYTYGPVNARPHAVDHIVMADGSIRQYSYDGVGNLTQEVQRDASNNVIAAKGRLETWTSFNMPLSLTSPASTATFVYGPEHQRIKMTVDGTTTTYLNPDNAGGLLYEKDVKSDGTIEHRHFVTAGGAVVALIKQTGTGTQTVLYMHSDHLGSATAITNASGAVIERMAYEPFGKRRTPQGAMDPNNIIAGVNTDRGYTNHEHLDGLDLIHMNGRVYDPAIGRFISADPNVPYPTNIQSYSRYSYTRNNPLVMIDPSGFSDFYSSDPLADPFDSVFRGSPIFSPWIPTTLPPVTSHPQITPACVTMIMGPGRLGWSCPPVPIRIPPVTLQSTVLSAMPKVLAPAFEAQWLTLIKTVDMLSQAKACGWSVDCYKSIIAGTNSGQGNKQDNKVNTPDQQALGDLVKDESDKGRKPVSNEDADTLLDWGRELGVDVRDDRNKNHWIGGPHIHIPGTGVKHIPVRDK